MNLTVVDTIEFTESPIENILEDNRTYLAKLEAFLTTISYHKKKLDKEQEQGALSNYLNQCTYYFALNFGFFKNFLENFISLKVTLDSLNLISNTVVTSLSIAFGILNLVLFYAFEVSIIRDNLEIKASISESIELLHLYQQQLKVAKDINRIFFNRNNPYIKSLSKVEYNFDKDFIKNMNESFKHKIKEDQPLSTSKQILKYLIFGLGGLSCVVAEYFVSQYLLQILSEIVSLSPTVYWTLTSLWMIYVLTTYSVLSGSSVLSLIHPEYEKLKELGTQYQEFLEETEINLLDESESVQHLKMSA